MLVDAAAVSRMFGLGAPTSALRPLPGLSSAAVWALDTQAGAWVVKSACPANAGELAILARSSTLEELAARAGVATARAVPPSDGVGYWAPVGDSGILVRVSERVAGARPAPASASVAPWVGATIATIAALGVGRGQPTPIAQPDEWDRWLTAAALEARCRQTLRSVLIDLVALVGQSQAGHPQAPLAHCDINRRNIVITATGPVLLDFDNAAPQVPWWELVHHTFLLSCRDLGRQEPAVGFVPAAVLGYLDAGGEPGRPDPSAFSGLLAGLATWLAENLRRAPSNRQAASAVRQATVSLPSIMDSVDRWAQLLR